MDNYLIFTLVGIILILNGSANFFIKKGALSNKSIFFNYKTITGYICFLATMFLALKLMFLIQLKIFSLVMAINCFATYLIGVIFFNEKTNKLGILGIILVCLGIIIFNKGFF